jgi:hypothetical protein
MSEDTKIRDYTKDKLYELVPAIYRQLEAKSDNKPLEALLKIISRQVDVLEEDVAGLYDNWFVETCDEWVTAYIADLVGARSLGTSRVASVSTGAEVSQRAYVANTIAYRRRKGTLAVLEQLSKDITSWDSHAVEFFQLLETTQHFNHIRLSNHRTPDIRDTNALELLDTPFDKIVHTVEVRRISSGRGFYNIPNVGIFLWRLQPILSDDTPAFRIEPKYPKLRDKCFTFHPLGYDEPMFNIPETEAGIASISKETNVSAPIRMRALYENIEDYYGRSLSVKVRYADDLEERLIPAREIKVCNLKDWLEPKKQPVYIEFDQPHYGTSDEMIITVADSAANSDPNTKEKVPIRVWSDSDAAGLTIEAHESDTDSGIFSINVSTSTSTDASSNTIGVKDGDTVYAAYDYGTGTPAEGTALIKSDRGTVAIDPVLGRIRLSKKATEVHVVYYHGFSSRIGGGCYARQGSEVELAVKHYVVSARKAFVWSGIPADAAETDHLRAMLRNDYGIEWLKPDTPFVLAERKITATQDGHNLSITLGTGNETANLNSDGINLATLFPREIGGKIYVSEKQNIYRSVNEALLWWKSNGDDKAVIEIADSEVYPQDVILTLAEGSVLEIRAAQEERPILGGIKVQGAKSSRLVLDGLWIDKQEDHSALTVEPGEMESITIKHCTIVPNLEHGNQNFAIGSESEIVCDWESIGQPAEASKLREFLFQRLGLSWVPEGAEFEKHSDTEKEYASHKTGNQKLRIEVEDNSTLAIVKTTSGGVWKKVYEFSILTQDGKRTLYSTLGRNDNLKIDIEKSVCGAINVPGSQLSATDSIIDGLGKEAILVRTGTVEQSTIFGRTLVEELALASNSIFTGLVNAKMDQKGCARFSYIPPGSKAPRRYKCQPSESSPNVEPYFTSNQYGNPGYGQLHRKVDAEIFEGADNGAEMGAFNHLLQAHRISDLKSALDEYLRFGLEAGVFLVS